VKWSVFFKARVNNDMDIKAFSRHIMELMPQIMKGALRQEHNYLSQGKITLPQFHLLVYLCQNPVSKMSDVAAHLGATRPAATGIIDRLIVQKLVTRRYDCQDRRIIWIDITRQGRRIVKKIETQKFQTLIAVFSKISAEKRNQYLNILKEIAQILNVDTFDKVTQHKHT
jgi:MarR family transcriptional regulator, organic hydroperoxide resistance regulator